MSKCDILRRRFALLPTPSVIEGALIAAWCVGAFSGGCSPADTTPTVTVDFSDRLDVSSGSNSNTDSDEIRVGVAAMLSPASTRRTYDDLLNLIARTLNVRVRMIQPKTYQEVNDQLSSGELDAAFICSGGYAAADEAPEILAVPVVNGRTTYRAYIVARHDSDIRNFGDLRGRSFVFTDPLSNSGWLYPVSRVLGSGATPSSFFVSVGYTYSHDRSIDAVADGLADGASVDGLVFDFLRAEGDESVKGLRVVERSPEFGIPPFVAGAALEKEMKPKLTAVLLQLHQSHEGESILGKLRIEKFAPGDESDYDAIRRLRTEVGPWRP